MVVAYLYGYIDKQTNGTDKGDIKQRAGNGKIQPICLLSGVCWLSVYFGCLGCLGCMEFVACRFTLVVWVVRLIGLDF